ncbi:four helix bundle protein [Dyadobacter sp. BHUBP1]|uniref:four helix bundle protein n=1 Tax=Dyadobacter sp. BHUBP1 TaxID=3424178 RepID=UPI003D34AFAB
MRDFRKYEVWRISHEFVLDVYIKTRTFPANETYGVTSQIRRASVSIPTNLAEGCGRTTDLEFARFIHISLGSAHEVEYLLQLSKDLEYLSDADYSLLNERINLIKRMLYNLEKSITKKPKA